jgi:hypothetical protein
MEVKVFQVAENIEKQHVNNVISMHMSPIAVLPAV